MARPLQPARLTDIAAAAREQFGRLGYRRTKMAEVAAAAGLSAGAVYTYVESKDALLHVVFADFFGHYSEGLPDLPVRAPAFSETLEIVRQGLRSLGTTPRLRAAVELEAPPDVLAELTAIATEYYQMVSRLWPILAVIESCSVDLPELYRFYFERRRRSQLSLFARYVERRSASGHLLPTADAELSSQLVVEAITWHAWHRLEGFDAERFSGDKTPQIVTAFVARALAGVA